MFLLDPSTAAWDFAILCLTAGGFGISMQAAAWAGGTQKRHWFFRTLAGLVSAAAALAALMVVYGSFVEPRIIMVTSGTVPFPTATPMKIAVLSDLHVGPYKGADFVERLVDKTNEQLPDLVLIAGDFLFDDQSPVEELQPLSRLRAPLGVFAVIGNHDAGRYLHLADLNAPEVRTDRSDELATALESFGVRVLRNTREILNVDGRQVALLGIDDIWSDHSSLDAAFAGLPEGEPTILLSHNPDVILDTLSQRANLIVAGHTHGGQIRLPWLGPVAPIPSRLGKRYDQGVFQVGNDTTLAITRGAGESLVRARLFAWPEVLVLTTQTR